MTNFGTPRNTSTKVKAENLQVQLEQKSFLFEWIFSEMMKFGNLVITQEANLATIGVP